MSELPSGWASARIPELVGSRGLFVDGDWVESKDQDADGEVRLIQLADVGDGQFLDKSNRSLSRTTASRLGCSFLRGGDLLVARMPEPLGRACLFPIVSRPCVTVVDVCIIRGSNDDFDQAWLMYFINSPSFRGDISSLQSGSTRKRISRGNLSTLTLPVPPRAEQTRIVAKLEELLSELDAGVAELKAAQRKLARYRQSLLKAAVEGALTAEWRQQHTPAESGAQLLERILVERRARWEAKQLAKFMEQGKTPPKDWRQKYPEPLQPDTTNLPELPEGWVWASLSQLLAELTSGSRDWAPYYDRGSSVFVMAQNVRPWRPDFSFKQHVDPPLDHRDRARSEILVDDLLVTIVGANTGQICRVAEPLDGYFVCQSVALLRLAMPQISEYINVVLNSEGHGQLQFREMNYGAGRPHLSFDQLDSVCIPLAPLEEQTQIVSLVLDSLASIERVEVDVALLFRNTTAQRQNILRAAFAGELVAQDPNDEPASLLLERIRAEREAAAAAARPSTPRAARGRRAKA